MFVPRPETELLAGWAVERRARRERRPARWWSTWAPAPARSPRPSPTRCPQARVHAVELDEEAHAWAARNLAGTGVDLRQGDLADAFDDLAGTVDVVVSNPPYIPHEAWESVAAEARDHDPDLALYVDRRRARHDPGRRAARRPAAAARGSGRRRARRRPGRVRAGGLRRDRPLEQVRDHPDLAGRARFLTARLAR